MPTSLPAAADPGGFIAINHIQVRPDYRERMEESFRNRARAVDRREGFIDMEVLRPATGDDPYLVISRWRSREDFDAWANDSEEFRAGHSRAFADLAAAQAAGEDPPMRSTFHLYTQVTRS
jgi:heme oxygenase (mycobilin-producing)